MHKEVNFVGFKESFIHILTFIQDIMQCCYRHQQQILWKNGLNCAGIVTICVFHLHFRKKVFLKIGHFSVLFFLKSITCFSQQQTVSNKQYVVIADYDKVEDTELSISEGDIVDLQRVGKEGWWFVSLQSQEVGWVPGGYLAPFSPHELQASSFFGVEGVIYVLFVSLIYFADIILF